MHGCLWTRYLATMLFTVTGTRVTRWRMWSGCAGRCWRLQQCTCTSCTWTVQRSSSVQIFRSTRAQQGIS